MPEGEPVGLLALLQELYRDYELNQNTTTADYNKSSFGQIAEDADEVNDILSFCGIVQEYEFWQTWQSFVFWFEGVLILVVGSVGFLGDVLATYILASSEETQWTTFNYLLIGLSVFDLLFLSCSIPVHTFPIPGMTWLNAVHNTRLYCIIHRFVLYPFSSVTYTAGVFITMAMTIERFQAVCYPHYYRNSLVTSTPLKRAIKFIITATLAAFLLEAPKFLEIEIREEVDGTTACVASELTIDTTFVDWKKAATIIHPFFTTTLIPIAMLFVMNTCIYRGIANNYKRQATMHPGQQVHHSASKLQAVLIIICVLFVMTHSPRLILAVLAFAQRKRATRCSLYNVQYIPELYVVCMETVSNLLIHVNASSNLLIFSCTSVQFNDVFRLKFPWLVRCSRNSSNVVNCSLNLEDTEHAEGTRRGKRPQYILMATLSNPKTLSKNHQIPKATSSNILHTHYAKARKRFASMSDLSLLQGLAKSDEEIADESAIGPPTVYKETCL